MAASYVRNGAMSMAGRRGGEESCGGRDRIIPPQFGRQFGVLFIEQRGCTYEYSDSSAGCYRSDIWIHDNAPKCAMDAIQESNRIRAASGVIKIEERKFQKYLGALILMILFMLIFYNNAN